MIPADQRPYIGGSGDNTVLGLIVNYNGMHRLENGMADIGGGQGFPQNASPVSGGMPAYSPGRLFLCTGGPQNRTVTSGPGQDSTDQALPPGMPRGPAMAGEPPGGLAGGPPRKYGHRDRRRARQCAERRDGRRDRLARDHPSLQRGTCRPDRAGCSPSR